MHRSFSYVDSYNGDIRFDNIYISTYFCQIDERRKKLVSGNSPDHRHLAVCPLWLQAPEGQRAKGRGPWCPSQGGHFIQGKRTLLPLRKAEEKTIIFPYNPTMQASETKNVVRIEWGEAPGANCRLGMQGEGRGIRRPPCRAGGAAQLRACSPLTGERARGDSACSAPAAAPLRPGLGSLLNL